MEGRPEGKGKEENSHKSSLPALDAVKRRGKFFPGWIRFSGMSVIQNLEDSGKGEEPFFQAGLRVFFYSAFLRWEHYLAESGLFRFPPHKGMPSPTSS